MSSLSFLAICVFLLMSWHAEGFMILPTRHLVRNMLSRSMASTISPSKPTIPNNNGFQVEHPIDTNPLVNLCDTDFDEAVASNELSVVLFGASWCSPCSNMARTLGKCAESSSAANFYQIDTDANPETASVYSVRSIPSVLFFRAGRVVSEVVGSVPAAVIEKQLAKYAQMWSNEEDDGQSYQ